MTVLGMTLDRGRAWVATAPARWPRIALVVAGFGALLASALGDDTACSASDPTVCGPDVGFSVAVVLAFGAMALVWWFPVAAAACAVAFAVVDVVVDPLLVANLSWSALALLHLVHLAVLYRDRRESRRIAEQASVPLPALATEALRRAAPPGPAPLGVTHVAVVALVLGAVAAGGMLVRSTWSDAEHEQRARTVTARVASYDEATGETVFTVDRPEAGVPAEVSQETVGVYDVGDVVPFRVDPADPGWAHPVAEPPDPTWWLTIALGALLVAGLLTARVLAGRVHRGVVTSSPPERGVPVRWLEGDDLLGVMCTDDDTVVGEVEVLARPREALLVPRLEAAVRDGWLVGDVRPGGWASLVHGSGVELAVAPLRALPDLPPADDSSVDPDLADDPFAGSDPVPEAAQPAVLPVTTRPPAWRRALGLVTAVAVPGLAWWALGWEEAAGFKALGVAAGAVSLVVWGLGWALSGVEVRADEVVLTGPVARHRIPVSAVTDVRVSQEAVVLVLDDEDWVEIGPWAVDPGGPATPVAPARSPTAAEVAAAVDDRRVVARAASSAGGAVTHGPGPGVLLLVPAVLVVLVRLGLVVFAG